MFTSSQAKATNVDEAQQLSAYSMDCFRDKFSSGFIILEGKARLLDTVVHTL